MMDDHRLIERRTACATILGVGGALLGANALPAAEPTCPPEKPRAMNFNNRDFYDAAGRFKEQAAKEAYVALMKGAGYPISDHVLKNLWIAEFGLGRFAEVGLGGSFWVNSKEWNYASVEIFLLPGQMIPEHWHVAIQTEKVVPKMESWIIRFGTGYAFGEGEPTAHPQARIPRSEAQHTTVRKETVIQVGQVAGLARPEEKHFLVAGAQGAIVTEVSTFHTGAAVRFTNPAAKL